jgi:glutamate N-acetyltransferase/amino-acid N-acetyltransferase
VCEIVAQSLNIDTEQVMPFSTGVIGQPLPMQCFKDNIAKLSTRLANDNLNLPIYQMVFFCVCVFNLIG